MSGESLYQLKIIDVMNNPKSEYKMNLLVTTNAGYALLYSDILRS